jgi:AAA domain-containing protein
MITPTCDCPLSARFGFEPQHRPDCPLRNGQAPPALSLVALPAEKITEAFNDWAGGDCKPWGGLDAAAPILGAPPRPQTNNSFLPPKGAIGKGTNFRPLSAAELLAREPQPLVWVWEPFLPEGTLNLLVAFMKVGKSTLVYALALAVAQGQAFLGYPTKQGGVLILAVEEHPRDVRRRLERFGMRPEDPIYVHAAPLDKSPSTVAALKAHIVDKGIKLVILDTLARWWAVEDENNNAQIVREVSPLLDMAHETGAAVLIVHHERKSGGGDGRGIRGGSALFGIVDQALMLERRQGGNSNQRTLKAIGRYDETPGELILELDGDAYQLVGAPDGQGQEARGRRVLEALTEEPQDVEAVAAKAGLSPKLTREALEKLCGDGQAVREGKGVKGSPHRYRRTNSLPSHPPPIGEGTNPEASPTSPAPAGGRCPESDRDHPAGMASLAHLRSPSESEIAKLERAIARQRKRRDH